MSKTRVLFISQAITPFVAESHISKICRYLPQKVQESGREIRTFMPKFGCINERRNQLHEVIRLSGMNLIINDNDFPLIIKVASIQQARMQVYFIENDEFFHSRKAIFRDNDGNFFSDNDDRTVFFNRGVFETVKKLGWSPHIIHVHGWMAALSAFYLKVLYKDNPLFYDCKVIVSLYNDFFPEKFSKDFYLKIKTPEIDLSALKDIQEKTDYVSYMKFCLQHADGVVFAESNIHNELIDFVKERKIAAITHRDDDNYVKEYLQFYDEVFTELEICS